MIKLFHYVHCPFCIRVRMAFGYLGLEFESIVLPYDDEETPLALTEVKMLPILQFSTSKAMNESLDIIKKIDSSDKLNNSLSINSDLEKLLSDIGTEVHSLCMPYWVWTPEFNQTSRQYFQNKKEVKRGPFKNLIKNKEAYLKSLNKILASLESKLTPFYENNELTIKDIMLASHLWGMYVFPEFQFSSAIHNYLQSVKQETKFDYHRDFWS